MLYHITLQTIYIRPVSTLLILLIILHFLYYEYSRYDVTHTEYPFVQYTDPHGDRYFWPWSVSFQIRKPFSPRYTVWYGILVYKRSL